MLNLKGTITVISLLLCYPLFSQYAGGNSGGQVLVSKTNIVVCAPLPRYTEITMGGDGGGNALVSKTDIVACAPLIVYSDIYMGGDGGGQAFVSKIDMVACAPLPRYSEISVGGDGGGQALVSKIDMVACAPLPRYSEISVGGDGGGQALVSSGCAVLLDICSLTLTDTIINASCPSGSDGAIDLTITSGIAPYTYLWSNGATTEDLTKISEGTYSVTVTDSIGCKDSIAIVVGNDSLPLQPFSGTYTIGGTAPDYATIADALFDLGNCKILTDTVIYLIREGIYNDSINMDSTFIYAKDSLGIPVIFMAQDTGDVQIASMENVVTIENKEAVFFLEILFQVNSTSGNAITITSSDNIIMSNCIIDNSQVGATAVNITSSNFIQINSVQANNYNFNKGVILTGSGDNNVVTNCEIEVQEEALLIDNQTNLLLSNNKLIGSVDTPVVSLKNTSANLTIIGNEITGEGDAIYLEENTALTNIEKNKIITNVGYGIFIKSYAGSSTILNNEISSTLGGGIKVKDNTTESDVLDAVSGKEMFIVSNEVTSLTNGIDIERVKKSRTILLNNQVEGDQIGMSVIDMEEDAATKLSILGNLITTDGTGLKLENNLITTKVLSNTIVSKTNTTNTSIVFNNTDHVRFYGNNVVNESGADVVIFDTYTPTDVSTDLNNWFSFVSSTITNKPSVIISATDFLEDPKFNGSLDYSLSTKSGLLDTLILDTLTGSEDSLLFMGDVFGNIRGGRCDIGAIESEATGMDGLQIDIVLEDGIVFYPGTAGPFNEFEIQGLSNYTTVNVKVFTKPQIGGVTVYDSNSKTTFWDGIDMNTSALVNEDLYSYQITIDSIIIKGLIYVKR